MTLKYENKIYEGILKIGDRDRDYIDPEVTNLMFVEKFNIQTLILCIRIDMYVKLRSNTIKELILGTQRFKGNKLLNLNLDDLDLENLEVLDLENNNLVNDQLYNLTKFKKLNTLNVSWNKVGLMNIHSVTSLIKLYMRKCNLKNIDLISSLVNLHELDLSKNTDLDLSPLCKVKSLKKLSTVVGPRNAFLNQEEE
ncbi:S11IP_protein [Hexamita inflata]|uniref:S11IP protein n=1 Tax=Hexamita inflata TaxID=28002 RepID=A0AA86V2T0_9EUKA|nr:S11IP protein [Hexamita inflata]